MYDLDDDLKQKIKEINISLRKTYGPYNEKSREFKRDFINKHIGNLIMLNKMSDSRLSKYNNVIGVDGSTNRLGGVHPHYIELFQGLAKSTNNKYEDIIVNDVYTPILEINIDNDEEIIDKKRQLLAAVELDAAILGAKDKDPDIIMMDGGLVRYKIDDKSRYEELREKRKKKNIILIGVIKDVKTNMISISFNQIFEEEINLYDREMLNGVLNIGECILIRDEVNKKYSEDKGDGFSSVFMRLSNSPNIVGLDILDTQANRLEEMADFVYSMTPKNSRGVPLWIDIVDSEVRITDELLSYLILDYIDRDLYEVFFNSERMNRTM